MFLIVSFEHHTIDNPSNISHSAYSFVNNKLGGYHDKNHPHLAL